MVTSDANEKITGKHAGKLLHDYFRQPSAPQGVGLSRSASVKKRTDYLIRRALDSELVDIHALIPEMAVADIYPGIILIACSTCAPVILGAAVASSISGDIRLGVRVNISVRPSQQRQGIGSALLGALKNELAQQNVNRLLGWCAYESGTEALFLRHNGFQPQRRVQHFQADIAVANAECSARLANFSQSGDMPENIELSVFSDTSLDEAAELYARHTGTSSGQAYATLNHYLCSAIRGLSFELRHDGRLQGFLFSKYNDKALPEIDLWVGAPEFHDEWQALQLLQKTAQSYAEHGLTKIRFHCREEAKSLLHIARIIHARLLREKRIYALDIASAI